MTTPDDDNKQIDDKYFESYNDLEIHRLMVDDAPRTKAYQDAILKNAHFFRDKVVMDIGSGTGILALFAAKAGAKRVHAVEASPMAKLIPAIAKCNGLDDKIVVHACMVESLTAEQLSIACGDHDAAAYKVDIIISEWMGFYLVHESMLTSVLNARDKFLKTDGLMFPLIAKLYAAPCSLSHHYAKFISFWRNCYGLSFAPLEECAKQMRLTRPEIDCIQSKQLLSAKRLIVKLNLKTMQLSDLDCIEKEVVFAVDDEAADGVSDLDGVALWFDTVFAQKDEVRSCVVYRNNDSSTMDDTANPNQEQKTDVEFQKVTLSTSPSAAPTHWKQTLIFLPERRKVKKDDVVGFQVRMKPSPNNYRLYDIELNILPEDHAQCQLLKAMIQQESDVF